MLCWQIGKVGKFMDPKKLRTKYIEIFPERSVLLPLNLRPWEQTEVDEVTIYSDKGSFVADQVASVAGIIGDDEIGMSEKAVVESLGLRAGEVVRVDFGQRTPPESYAHIRERLTGQPLKKSHIYQIVEDIAHHRLTPLENSILIASQVVSKWSLDEIEHFARAMASSGELIKFEEACYDKHSLGGVPGNKVSLLIVPIIASAGLLIPKTSSRAITSPSGTADTMEALGCEVSFSADEIVEISSRTKGMICWGGALNLAPADDELIRAVERPLGLNPHSMMLASIMAKKLAMGTDFVVLDFPTGKGTKVPDLDTAMALARDFGELGRRLGIRVECGITYGSSPVGHTVGPALEAREALQALKNPQAAASSLIEKSAELAGILLEMAGKALRGQGPDLAKKILYGGKAYAKMKEIIEAQGGDPNISPDDIEVGEYVTEWWAPADGWVVEIDNSVIGKIAQAAGAPSEKRAGIVFLKKKDPVRRGEVILRIHAASEKHLAAASSILAKRPPVTIEGMLLGRI